MFEKIKMSLKGTPKLKREKMEVYKSLNIMLDFYEEYLKEFAGNKTLAKEKFFNTFHEYYLWLQGKNER